MRISTSQNYHHGDSCNVGDCQRRYCTDHRLLWNDCDTAKKDWDGRGRKVWMLGECPDCERDFRVKEAQRYAKSA